MTELFLRVGERFLDRYEITEVLGAGGMSRVYGAVQDGLDRKVAIKLLSPVGAEQFNDDQFENVAARFRREAKIVSQLRSPHTMVMYDYGMQGDHLYMILEYVDGKNLHELVEAEGPLPPRRVARIIRQALASLAEAHQMGVLHRDIKPQNIMVYDHLGDPDNTKVLDFGIAKAMGETGKDTRKLTEERTIVGTPSYMSPEQILGNSLTPASDIYSLGLVAYELLFGITAVEADSAVSTMARHLAPTPIEIPSDGVTSEDFLNVLRRMVAKDADKRYQTAAEVFRDLQSWDSTGGAVTLPRISDSQPGAPTLEGTPRPTHHTTTQTSNTPLVATGLFLGVAILIAVGVVFMMVQMMSDREEPETPSVAPVALAVETPAKSAAPAEPEAVPAEQSASAVVLSELREASSVAAAAAVAAEEFAAAQNLKDAPSPPSPAPKRDNAAKPDPEPAAGDDAAVEPEPQPEEVAKKTEEPPKAPKDDFVDIDVDAVQKAAQVAPATAEKKTEKKKVVKKVAPKAEPKATKKTEKKPSREVPLSF